MVTYWAFRLASFLLGLLPLRVSYWLAELIAQLSYLASARTRKQVKANLRRVVPPETSEAEISRLARGVFRTGMKNYVELLLMPSLSSNLLRRRVRIHGLENMDAALAKGRGVVMAGAHFGSYESSAQSLTIDNYRVLVPAEPLKPRELFEFISRRRASHGIAIVPAERGTVRQVVKWLRSNGIVAFACDRDAIGAGVPHSFFGAETRMPPAAASMARRERCPVVVVNAIRRADNTTDMYVEPPLEMQVTEDEAADLAVNMRQILAVFERYIRANPDQWVAFVPVWKDQGSENANEHTSVEPHTPVGQSRPSHS